VIFLIRGMVANAAQNQTVQRIRQNFNDIMASLRNINETDKKILDVLRRKH